jgi:hypothetical protein
MSAFWAEKGGIFSEFGRVWCVYLFDEVDVFSQRWLTHTLRQRCSLMR